MKSRADIALEGALVEVKGCAPAQLAPLFQSVNSAPLLSSFFSGLPAWAGPSPLHSVRLDKRSNTSQEPELPAGADGALPFCKCPFNVWWVTGI